MDIKKTFSAALVALCALPLSLSMSSCDSSGDSDGTELTAQPLYVTAEQFAAARYSYLFVAQAGKLIRITPTQGGAVGDPLQGILSIDGTDIAAPVTMSYVFDGNLLGPDLPSSSIDASGTITLVFNEDRGDSVRFFQELGVIFPDPLVEDTDIVLGEGTGFSIKMLYINPGEGGQTASASANAVLGPQMVRWEIDGVPILNELALSVWMQSTMLQGAYSIIRN